jgi:hypothetical protein
MPPENYLHSDVQEIMVTKPSFVLKWGNVLISGLLVMLLAFTAWFKYPEFITTDISLTAQTSVKGVMAPAGNRGAVLLVPNGAFVRRNTPLVAWQDADRTAYHEVQKLKQVLQQLPPAELARQLQRMQPALLGQLRPVYQALLVASASGAPLAAPLLTTGRKQVQQWEQQNVACAPQDGIAQVSARTWSAADAIPAGQAVLSVRPRQATFLALGAISREDYATVRRGQEVLLQVHELGSQTLTGHVQAIAPLARNHQHQVVIRMAPAGQAQLYPSFSGSARIMLRQQSLLAKFLAR